MSIAFELFEHIKIFKFSYFQSSPDLLNLLRHNGYYCMREGAFLNISFKPQLIN